MTHSHQDAPGSPFHRGEKAMQERVGLAARSEQMGRRMLQPRMSPQFQTFTQHLETLFVGAADAQGRPWVSVLSGSVGFLRPLNETQLLVQALPLASDPMAASLEAGTAVGTLGMHFPTRSRIRVNGTVTRTDNHGFVLGVAQAYGNCDMYIQTRELTLHEARAATPPVHRARALSASDADLVAAADTFFIGSQAMEAPERARGVDVSHRGGRPGFALVSHESLVLFPDYPGNGMFNTLGNLQVDPRAGMLFIDFASGDTLQLTGHAEVLWEPHHAARFPGAERVVAFRIDEAVRTERAVPIDWTFGQMSPVFDRFAVPELVQPKVPIEHDGTLLSIQVSTPRDVSDGDRPVRTGIFKEPVNGPVMLRRLHLEGDGQADRLGHGGAFRAVYVYPKEHYASWSQELGRDDFVHGQFGENFTVTDMLEDDVCIGDVFRVGDALVEVSQPRTPCFKLALKMGIEGFDKTFVQSGRVGFYLRVLEEGAVQSGDTFRLVGRDPRGMSVRRAHELLFFDTDDLEGARQALSIGALAHGWKESFERRLSEAERTAEPRSGLRQLVVTKKVVESETITSFYLEPTDGQPLASYRPGQFLPFSLDLPGGEAPVVRTYSLSDAPGSSHYRVTVKREPSPNPGVPAGLASNHFHDHVVEGTKLHVGEPRGAFQLDDTERPLVLLSAGVGITPLLSMLNHVVRAGSHRPVWFVHGTRHGGTHAFGDHIRRIAATYENVHAHIAYSQPRTQDVMGRDYDSCGRIDVALLKKVLPFDDFAFYLVGPVAFMRSLHAELTAMGVAESRIHYEFFGPGTSLTPSSTEPEASTAREEEARPADETHDVTFARSQVRARWNGEQGSLLELGEQAGVRMPYSCRSGICQTCACTLVEGDVEYTEPPLTSPPPGKVLTCIARPRSLVVLDA